MTIRQEKAKHCKSVSSGIFFLILLFAIQTEKMVISMALVLMR